VMDSKNWILIIVYWILMLEIHNCQ